MRQSKRASRPPKGHAGRFKASGPRRRTIAIGDQTAALTYRTNFDVGRGARLVSHFVNSSGLIVVDDVAEWFGMSKGQLAETVGVRPETFRRVKRAAAPKTQTRVKEMLEIVGRVAEWAGGKDQAMAWYRAEPIPAFGGRTAEFLVKDGKAAAVREFLDHVAVGGFA